MSRPDQNCHGCNQPFHGTTKFTMVGRFYFHENCTKCDHCHQKIADVTQADIFEDMVVCKKHIDNKEIAANPACPTCGKEFTPLDKKLVNIFSIRYHRGCVRCSDCSANIPDNQWQGYKQRPVCQACFEKIKMVPCIKCKNNLKEDEQNVVLQVGVLCPKCFKCIECHKQLKLDDKFYQLNENVYCNACDIPFRRAKYLHDRTRGGPG